MSDLLRPLSQGVRLHCIVVPENETVNESENPLPQSFLLKYEQFGSYIPLLRAKQRPRRFFNMRYQLHPVERRKERRPDFWGQARSPSQAQRRSRGLRGSIRRHQLTAQTSDTCNDTAEPSQEAATSVDNDSSNSASLIIAEIEGNTVSKHYKFISSYEANGSNRNPALLGTLNVVTHYIKCEPRDITVGLCTGDAKITLTSKKPEWNQQFGIFELDFGGRINRDSVKNFQIDLNDEVVSCNSNNNNSNFFLFFVLSRFTNLASQSMVITVWISSIHSLQLQHLV